ncbi:MAG: metallophosphoesterase family protein [Candidatus Magnetomorum sp.]|nr:metallophosphoesterase family protein [Candidatus Magnetomorum sp.]
MNPLNQKIVLPSEKPIGILADSHGQVSTLEAAIDVLYQKGCQTIIHLGDICDSSCIHTADESIHLIQKNNIIAIKGNNDHSLTVSGDPRISPSTHHYLKKLPLVVHTQHILFTHSLPFMKELGLSCMIQQLNDNHIHLFFGNGPEQKILFRGHNHQPELVTQNHQHFQRMPLNFPTHIQLTPLKPFIMTCGAVLNSHCGIFYPESFVFHGILLNSTSAF